MKRIFYLFDGVISNRGIVWNIWTKN